MLLDEWKQKHHIPKLELSGMKAVLKEKFIAVNIYIKKE